MNLTEEASNARQEVLELLIVPFELLWVAEGHPLVCQLSDGREVRVRIPTDEEEASLRAMIKPLRFDAPAEAVRRGMFNR